MRIGILSTAFAPERTGIGPYSHDLAVGLLERGHDVRVVSTFPFYPAWKAEVPGKWTWVRRESSGGVPVTRVRCYVPRSPTTFRRILHDLSFAGASLVEVVRLVRWSSVTVVVSPALGSALQGVLLSALRAGRLHLHIQDLVTDLALEVAMVGGRVMRGVADVVGKAAYRPYRSISVLSEAMGARLRELGIPASRISVLPNWIRVLPKNLDPDRTTDQTDPYVIFSGSFGKKQGLRSLAELANVLHLTGGPRVVVLGDGAGRDQLGAFDGRHLEWAGLVDDVAYDRYLRRAAMGLVTLTAGVGASVVPSKLVTYMAYGLPILVMADAATPAAQLIKHAKCGEVVHAGDAAAAAEAVRRMVACPEGLRQQGEAGRAYALRHWSRDVVIDRFVDVLRRAATGTSQQ